MRVAPESLTGRCRVIMSSKECAEPPAYRVTFDDCAACRDFYGWLLCGGHSACIRHAAEVRTNEYSFDHPADDGPAIPVRVHDAA